MHGTSSHLPYQAISQYLLSLSLLHWSSEEHFQDILLGIHAPALLVIRYWHERRGLAIFRLGQVWERFVSKLNFRFKSPFIFAKSQPSSPAHGTVHLLCPPILLSSPSFFSDTRHPFVLRSWPCPSSELELLGSGLYLKLLHDTSQAVPPSTCFNLGAISSYDHFCFSLYIPPWHFPTSTQALCCQRYAVSFLTSSS